MMTEFFDITQFESYREDNRREVKKAHDGLPVSLWDTYSAFANCYGGVIILGVKENKDGTWHTTGLQNAAKDFAVDFVILDNKDFPQHERLPSSRRHFAGPANASSSAGLLIVAMNRRSGPGEGPEMPGAVPI